MTVGRDQLVLLVDRIMTGYYRSEEAADRAVAEFEENVPHPGASGLIFYPMQTFDHEPTAEEIVDAALAYKPIEL